MQNAGGRFLRRTWLLARADRTLPLLPTAVYFDLTKCLPFLLPPFPLKSMFEQRHRWGCVGKLLVCLRGLSLAPCLKRIFWVWDARCRCFCSEDLPADPARLPGAGPSAFRPAPWPDWELLLLSCGLAAGPAANLLPALWQGTRRAPGTVGRGTDCLSCFCVFLPPLPRGGPPAGHLATTGFPGTRGWISSECCWHHTSVTSLASSALLGEG